MYNKRWVPSFTVKFNETRELCSCLNPNQAIPMSLASRCFARFLHRSPAAGAGAQNTILLARYRLLSSSSVSPGNGPTATKVAPAVMVTETKAGGGKTDQQFGSVKLDLCGEIEGVRSSWAGSFVDQTSSFS